MWLKQSTQINVLVGPFVDFADGVTPESGITLGTVDEALLVKHNATTAVDISARTWQLLTGGRGWYIITLTTGDTDTKGMLTILFHDDNVALPAWRNFFVADPIFYDSIVGSDLMQVDLQQMLGAVGPVQNLSASATGIITGNTVAGTLTNTEFTTDLSETTVNHYNDRVVVFTEGAMLGQAARITAYDGAGKLTVTPMTEAPSASLAFVIV